MKKVAARFKGNEGVVIHVGASDTIANPYTTWARMGKGKTPEDEGTLMWMHTNANDKTDGWWLCRKEVVSHRAYTAESDLESSWLFDKGGEKAPGRWPGRAVAAPGEDARRLQASDGRARNRHLRSGSRAAGCRLSQEHGAGIDLILDRGAIPIPTTSPPIRAHLKSSTAYNESLRELRGNAACPSSTWKRKSCNVVRTTGTER